MAWQALPSSLDRRSANNFTEGLQTDVSPLFVKDNTIINGYGWDFDEYPALRVRKGRTTYGTSGAATTRLLTNFGNTHLVRAVGTKLQYNSSGTTWTDIAGTWTDTPWDAANFDIGGPALILTNGTDVAQYWSGTALTANSDMPKGKYVASDNLRVYTAGVAGEVDTIFYCAFEDALDWTTVDNAGAVQYYTDRGGPITGLKSFQGRIWVFKKDTFALIFHTGNSKATHRLVPKSNNIGCAAYRTLVEAREYLFWLGSTSVYMGAGDGAMDIGKPIKRFLDQINPAAIQNSCAFVMNERYYLCIPTGSNTDPDTCLVYSVRYEKWLPYSITLGSISWGAELNNQAYAANSSGQTYKINDSTADAGTAITWRVESKPFDDGAKEAEKELFEMHLQGYFPSGSMLNVSVSPQDQGDIWETIEYDPIATQSYTQNKNLIVPLDVVPLCFLYRYRLEGTGPATVQEIQRYARITPVQY